MKNKKETICYVIACLLLASCCLLLAGCPAAMDPKIIKDGSYIRGALTGEIESRYSADLSIEQPPEVRISYQAADGMTKTARFILDGYDAKKKIGYKLVLKKDKDAWEKSRKDGDAEAPDLNDARLIMEAAVKYKYPVIFLWAYQFQNETDTGKVLEDGTKISNAFVKLTSTPEMTKWAEEGMRSGEWMREGMNEWALARFQIDFKTTDLPEVMIEYSNGKVTFKLDGYDAKRKIGYKFVTIEDEARWKAQREEGKKEAPNPADYSPIKQEALLYDYPVLFIAIPEYWKQSVKVMVDKELDELLSNSLLTNWLKEHP